MNDELTGVTDAVVEETEQAAAEQDNDIVNITDLLDESDTGDAGNETEPKANENEPEAKNPVKTEVKQTNTEEQARRDRENIAFAKRLAAEKRKFERDPMYTLGREFAAQYGGDASKALEAMRERQAEELAKDPTALAKYVVNQRNVAPTPEPEFEAESTTEEETSQQKANRIVNDIRNVLGDNADLKSYMEIDPDFMANCDKYGAAAAVAAMAQKATAQTRTAAKIEQNRRLPQPIRPSGNAQPKSVDFSIMSQKEWEAFEAKAKKARMDGKKIVF